MKFAMTSLKSKRTSDLREKFFGTNFNEFSDIFLNCNSILHKIVYKFPCFLYGIEYKIIIMNIIEKKHRFDDPLRPD